MTAKAEAFEDLGDTNNLEASERNCHHLQTKSYVQSLEMCRPHLISSVTPNLHETRYGIATSNCPIVYGGANGRLQSLGKHDVCKPWVGLSAIPTALYPQIRDR